MEAQHDLTTRGVQPSEAEPYILRLRDSRAQEVLLAGAKAARLSELARAGFAVPDGFVLTVRACARDLDDNGLTVDSSYKQALNGSLPEVLKRALREILAEDAEQVWAVRSSGVLEDGEESSFAGQFETVLGARGFDEVNAAIRRCWASGFSDRVRTYGRERGLAPSLKMAVLVQQLVLPEVAGVAFTANPVTSARDEVVLNAVRGLGERLVSGESTPDEWIVRGSEARCVSQVEASLSAEQALAVAATARRIEQHFGAPQDIEWAVSAGTVRVLQSRPISTLAKAPTPVPVEARPPAGYWTRNTAYFPEPLSPNVASFLPDAMNKAYRRFFSELGALAEGMETREIGGWVYMRLVPLGNRDLPVLPRWLLRLMLAVHPQARARIRQSVKTMRERRFDRYVEDWERHIRPDLARRIASFRDTDRTALSDAQLFSHVDATLRFVEEAVELHFLIVGAHFLALAEFSFLCNDWFSWTDPQILKPFSGLSEKSTEPTRKLSELAERIRRHPQFIPQVLENPRALAELFERDHELAQGLADYEREYRCRALRYEVPEPAVRELTLRLLREQLIGGYDSEERSRELEHQRKQAVAALEPLLRGRSVADRERFERLLRHAEKAYPIREDNEFYTMSAPLALARYAFLEVGRRLFDRRLIAAPADVVFLKHEEAVRALRTEQPRHALVTRRRGELAWVGTHPGPPSYGRPPQIPQQVDGLPSEAEFIFKAGIWMQDRGFAPNQSANCQRGAEVLEGLPASPGLFTGPVRVILAERDFSKIQRGDVLVCPIASPVWSVLFPSISALVTDTGGVLSHSAIVAREYRIPAVVATGNATEVLRDGQMVTVDGDRGTVRILTTSSKKRMTTAPTLATPYRRQSSRRRWLVLPGALLIVALAAAGYYLTARPVVVTPVVRGRAIDAVYATGTVEAQERVRVRAAIAGRIAEFLVNEGAVVKRGDLLARIDDPTVGFDLERAQASVSAATKQASPHSPRLGAVWNRAASVRAELKQATTELERIEQLFRRGTVPLAEEQRARSRVTSLRATLGALEAERAALRIDLETEQARETAQLKSLAARASETEVRAPLDGVVLKKHVELGERVDVNEVLLTNGNIDRLVLEISIDEADVAKVSDGTDGRPPTTAAVSVPAFPDRVFEGKLYDLLPDADRDRKVFLAKVDLNDRPVGLRSGMSADVNLIVQEQLAVLLAPTAAISDGASWVIRNGRAYRQPVRTGIRDVLRVEIQSGLVLGESVVVEGGTALHDRVRVRVSQRPPNKWDPLPSSN